MLAPTALSMKLVDMKLPYFFSMLPQPYVLMAAAADMLAANGIKTVAVIYTSMASIWIWPRGGSRRSSARTAPGRAPC